MPPPVVTPHPLKRGPAMPEDWRARFLEAYRTIGGIWRSAEAAGIHPETVRRARHADPEFNQAVVDAREFYADRLEERMLESAERSDNPAGFIVRLKALRPHEYIEKHAVMNFTVTTELGAEEGLAVLREMLGDINEHTRAQIAAGAVPGLPALTEGQG